MYTTIDAEACLVFSIPKNIFSFFLRSPKNVENLQRFYKVIPYIQLVIVAQIDIQTSIYLNERLLQSTQFV